MSGTEPSSLDHPTQAARSAARLAALRFPRTAVPEAVWEDAQRQLAGMLEGLETLQRAVPALGQPADAVSGTLPVSAAAGMGAGHGDAEPEVPPQHKGGRP